MKKLLLIITTFVLTIGVFAQRIEVQNASNYSRNNDLEKAIESAEKATTHTETAKDSKAWYLKGTILMKLDDMYSMVVAAKEGLTEKELNEKYAPLNPTDPNTPLKPESKRKIKNDDGSKSQKCTYLYDVVVIFDPDGKLESVSEPTNGKFLKEYNNDLLGEAIKSFENAIKFNTEDEFVTNSKINLTVISQRYYNTGVNYYTDQNFSEAAEYFNKSFVMGKDYLGVFDTISYELINNSIKMEMQQSLNNQDTTAFLKAIELGREKFPEDVFYVISEANVWLSKNNSEKALACLEEASKMVSDNPEIYYAIGVNYGNLGDIEKAVAAYEKAIELKPDYFEAQYNLGAIYVSKGNDISAEANNLPFEETEKYNELIEESNKYFEKAAPHLEKAYELNNKEVTVLTTLREIYVRLKNTDDVKRINDLIKATSETDSE
ncbi:MAG: tetratricopeptide repeat protein [Bacteroidales bacterium]|jgi:tetratricopeptide (TPR) repeat protein